MFWCVVTRQIYYLSIRASFIQCGHIHIYGPACLADRCCTETGQSKVSKFLVCVLTCKQHLISKFPSDFLHLINRFLNMIKKKREKCSLCNSGGNKKDGVLGNIVHTLGLPSHKCDLESDYFLPVRLRCCLTSVDYLKETEVLLQLSISCSAICEVLPLVQSPSVVYAGSWFLNRNFFCRTSALFFHTHF